MTQPTLPIAGLTSKAEAREKEWEDQRKEKRYDDDDDSDDNENEPALAIEPPPPAPPADMRYFPGQAGESRSVPDNVPVPIPGYSTQV